MRINRAPVLTLWASIVAERLGHDEEAALTLGKAVAGLNAQSKGRRLGIYAAKVEKGGDEEEKRTPVETIPLMGRSVAVVRTKDGVRALEEGKAMAPAGVRGYLEKKFGEHLEAVCRAMREVAASYEREDLAQKAYGLYETFRPEVPKGEKGWGAAGELDVKKIRRLKKRNTS